MTVMTATDPTAIRVEEFGEHCETLVARGHHHPLRFLAAVIEQACQSWGTDTAAAALLDAGALVPGVGDVTRCYGAFLTHEQLDDNDVFFVEVDAAHPKSVPVTVLTLEV